MAWANFWGSLTAALGIGVAVGNPSRAGSPAQANRPHVIDSPNRAIQPDRRRVTVCILLTRGGRVILDRPHWHPSGIRIDDILLPRPDAVQVAAAKSVRDRPASPPRLGSNRRRLPDRVISPGSARACSRRPP